MSLGLLCHESTVKSVIKLKKNILIRDHTSFKFKTVLFKTFFSETFFHHKMI